MSHKTCKTCETEKVVLEFPINSRVCKKCINKKTNIRRKEMNKTPPPDYFKSYYETNKEELKQKAREHYNKNKDEINKRRKERIHKLKEEQEIMLLLI